MDGSRRVTRAMSEPGKEERLARIVEPGKQSREKNSGRLDFTVGGRRRFFERGTGLAGNRDGHLLLLHRRPLLPVQVQREAFRELPVNFREDLVRFGETGLAVEQFRQE